MKLRKIVDKKIFGALMASGILAGALGVLVLIEQPSVCGSGCESDSKNPRSHAQDSEQLPQSILTGAVTRISSTSVQLKVSDIYPDSSRNSTRLLDILIPNKISITSTGKPNDAETVQSEMKRFQVESGKTSVAPATFYDIPEVPGFLSDIQEGDHLEVTLRDPTAKILIAKKIVILPPSFGP